MNVLLHLQTLIDGRWENAVRLEFREPSAGPAGACDIEYEFDYLKRWIVQPLPLAAVSLRYPVEFNPAVLPRWPAFLDDLRPMGSARRWWLQRLAVPDEPANELEILRRGTIAPVGNLRIAEAIPEKREEPRRFPRQTVIEQQSHFLAYAAEQGVQVGGATGAGGDSPKVLVRQSERGEIWIDVWQDSPTQPDRPYLVKFAREARERDALILRSEHAYYRALAKLGMDTISVDGMALEEGPNGPSLWLPRFDVARRDGREVRWGMESIFSLMGKPPQSWLHHEDVLKALRAFVTTRDWREVLLEYLRRDLLNVVFGNSDNHGRNMAVLKTDTEVRLAPIYDFAPMKMDLEGITRTTKWATFDDGGEVNWRALLKSFGSDEEYLRAGLHELAVKLNDLPELLRSVGLPEETLRFPPLGLMDTAKKLQRWSLL